SDKICVFAVFQVDHNSKYTAWSSVSTLIQKELVIKTHSPARYSLTDKGLELAQRLEVADQLLEGKNNVVRHSDSHSTDEGSDDANNAGLQATPATVFPQYATLSMPSETQQLYADPVVNSYHHMPDFTLLPGHFNVILCVDFIETTGGSAHKKQELVSELKRNGVNFDVRKLHIGDFLWIAQEKVHPVPGQLRIPQPRELVLDYVIERKRMDDLCGSIIDGRFREQKFRLKNCDLLHPIYLVEDYGSAQHLSIPEATLQQAIVNTQWLMGFFIKRTKDVRESAAYLTIMTRYLQNMFKNKTLLSCTKEEASKCHRVLQHDAQSCILMEFKEFNEGAMKNKAQTVKEVFARQLMQISGVSGEKAAAILERYNTPTSLLSAYENCSTEEKEKLLSSVKCGKLQRYVIQNAVLYFLLPLSLCKTFTVYFSQKNTPEYLLDIHSCVQNNISVLKKVNKAQNPSNSFYFHTHKCIGNTTHSIPNQNMKKNILNLCCSSKKN
ncbi:unnamed protein product, partial [Staurois parvus]